MPPRHMVRTKVRRFIFISIGMRDPRVRARSVHHRGLNYPKAVCVTDRWTGRQRPRAGYADRYAAFGCAARLSARVRHDSAASPDRPTPVSYRRILLATAETRADDGADAARASPFR